MKLLSKIHDLQLLVLIFAIEISGVVNTCYIAPLTPSELKLIFPSITKSCCAAFEQKE